MSYNSYDIRRNVRYILDNNPHDLKNIVPFYNGWNMLNCNARIPLEDILTSNTWTIAEKRYLLDFFQYICEHEDMTNLKFTPLYNIPPIDFALQFQNVSGAIAYLSSGGHLSTNSFEMIKHYITDVNEKAKIIKVIYSKYSKQDEFSIIDYHNQQIKKISLNDHLSYILAGDIETTLIVLSNFKDNSDLLNKLLYCAAIEGNKSQIRLLTRTIDSISLEQDTSETVFPMLVHPDFIKTAIQENNISVLKELEKSNIDLSTILLPPDKCISQIINTNPNYTEATALTPLQYAISTATDISIYDEENVNKRNDIIDYLSQFKSSALRDSSTYSQIIELFVRTGNMEKAQFYFDEATNKNIALDFSITTTNVKDNHYKYYIKHLPNNTKETL